MGITRSFPVFVFTPLFQHSNVVFLCPTCGYGDWQSKHNALFPIKSFNLEKHDKFRQIYRYIRSVGQVTQFWQFVLLHRLLKLFWHPPATLEFCVRWGPWVATESRDLCSGAPRTTHYYYNYKYCCVYWRWEEVGFKNLNSTAFVGVVIFILH